MFFCRRLWAISRNAYLVISCIVLFLLGLITNVVATVYIFTNTLELTTLWVGIHRGVVLSGDLLLTGSTIWYLLRHSHECALARGPAATILNRLRRLTLQSAAPTALCTLIHFAGNMKMDSAPALMINFIANMVAPSVVRVVRNVYSQLAQGDLSCRRKLLLHNKFTTNINRRPVKSGNYSPLTPGISRSSG
ncbi:hypothetical protein B0H14DRAFT_1132508 [Mycena olivaceomarginata]|nr:hypothetical protein B0H14DRAFT_1132508 [Mycena olivaceomarginata]